ncbi:MAG: hypothetical protein IH604_14635 [Burkholderiales bacterium]|nr:hypothetical protein [Burkholderiales bacterium]
MARDFWRHSGFHLLQREASGRLRLTDDFLRAYYLRPELRPVDASCAGEIALHQAMMAAPRAQVSAAQIDAIADADARSNYRVMLDFRARLLAASTLETCYLGLFSGGNVSVPPLFIDQMAQIILRNILEQADDALELRAAELFFREQKASVLDGAIMLADLETLELRAPGNTGGARSGGLAQLIADAQAPFLDDAQASSQTVNLDVIDRDNAQLYWSRDERHDLVISINHGRAALAAFCRVLERWILHLAGVRVNVASVPRIDEARWAWHIGLDAASTALLNDLWRGEDVGPERRARLLALFRLDFADAAEMRADLAGRPVYLALSMDENKVVRMKPQNLLVNLPLASAA